VEVENSLDGEWNLNIFKAKIRAHLRGEGKEKEKKKKDGKVKVFWNHEPRREQRKYTRVHTTIGNRGKEEKKKKRL